MKATLRADGFSPAVKEKFVDFTKLIEGFASAKYKTAADMLKGIFEKSGYAEILEDERAKNVMELISSAEGKDMKEFLDRISLYTNMDEVREGDYISLMTLHSAKGLEFPAVFVIGLEEGVLPYCKACEKKDEIAEERRLFYVGMTRARDILWLTGASKRRLYSKLQDQEPSRFLKDIPRECCHWMEKIIGPQAVRVISEKKKVEHRRFFTLYTAGCRVKHPTWGIGVVRDCYGDGDDIKVMVNFPSIGVKRLAVRFANLEKI
jgi:DNA helicase-2/ATP-dependent DNA helicase PcrA